LPALLLVLGAACAGDPADRIEKRRARYDASLQSFVVRDDPGAPQQYLLDVLVGWQGGEEPLPGLTLDVSMADAAGKVKAERRVWVDVSGVGRGGTQIALTLTDLPWQPGDGFFVELRSPVPAAQRAEYLEFGELGERSGTP
jgi:hypothetical protein